MRSGRAAALLLGGRLTRVLRSDDGLAARLVTEGSEPRALLALVESVPIASQLKFGPGFAIAQSHTLGSGGLLLTDAVARVAGLTLTLTISTVHRLPADIKVTAEEGDAIALPEDILAVLGWDCARRRKGFASTSFTGTRTATAVTATALRIGMVLRTAAPHRAPVKRS